MKSWPLPRVWIVLVDDRRRRFLPSSHSSAAAVMMCISWVHKTVREVVARVSGSNRLLCLTPSCSCSRSPLGGGGSQAPLDVRFGALAVAGSQSVGAIAGVQPGGGGHGRAGLLASPGGPAVLGGGGHGGPRAGLPPSSQQRAPGRLFSTEQLEELYTCPITHVGSHCCTHKMPPCPTCPHRRAASAAACCI